MNIHIVTDSCAHGQLPSNVTVVPNTITVQGKSYREGVDLSPEDALRLFSHQAYAPLIHVPTQAEYVEVYDRLANEYDAIISIHASREILTSWQNAKAATQQVMGRCHIELIDSKTISVGQGMLVRLAARSLAAGESLDEVVRILRGAVDRIYSVYYVEATDFLMQNRIMTPSHSILGMMLNLKPVLTVEEGRLVPMEKVRTRIQAIERLVEFAIEFTEVDDAMIVQHRPGVTDQTRMLNDRLAAEFPDRHFASSLYGASMAALIGAEATGLVILESEETDSDDNGSNDDIDIDSDSDNYDP